METELEDLVQKVGEEKNLNFRFNAIKHGILRETITAYEKLDYEAIYSQLEREFEPKNILENMLLERIVLNYIKLFRISKAEKQLINKSLHDGLFDKQIKIGNEYIPDIDHKNASKLDIYSRYETSAENRLYKAIAMLMSAKSAFAKQN